MATSGIYNLDLTLNQILIEAFDRLQIGADGETLSGDMQQRGRSSLNLMIKHWEQQGIHLWTYTEGSLFVQPGQEKYDILTSQVANEWFETKLTANVLAGNTAIPVTNTANMQVGDNVGIILADNSTQWTTIQAIQGNTQFVIPEQLTQNANSGMFVRNYRGDFIPVKRVLNVRRREGDDYEIPIVFESRIDYFNLPNKSQLGTPIQAYYQRGRDGGTFYLWNTPSSSVSVINFTYERALQIMSGLDDTLDLPEEWQEAVIANLAVKLIPKFGCSNGIAVELKESARESLSLALNFDSAVYPVVMEMQEYG